MGLYDLQIQLNKLQKQVKCLRCDVAEAGAGTECCTDLQTQIDAINLEIIAINEEIDALGGGVDLTALQNQVNDLETEVTNIQNSLITSTIQGNVANYSSLPSAALNTGEYWAVLADQGTAWLPGTLGGTYYAKGIYYSNGSTWVFMGSFPYEATQVQVDAGLANDVFVTPYTLENAAKWNDYLTISSAASTYQPLDGDLTSIAGLGFSSTAFLKKTALNTWTLDTNTYLTSETDPIWTSEKVNYQYVLSEKGEIINEDWTNLSDWTVGTGTWTVGSNLLNIPNGTTSYAMYLRNSGFGNTKLKKWTAYLNDYTIPTIGASSYGISFGLYSQSHAGAPNHYFVRFCTDTTSQGYIQIWAGGSSPSLRETSETFLTISSGDVTSMIVQRLKNSLIIKWRNETTDKFLLYRHEMPSNDGWKPPNLGQFTIAAHGGATTIGSVIIDSNELMNPKFAIVTDSTGTSTAGNVLESWTEALSNVIRERVILFSGNGDRIDDNNWNEVASYNPENIIISCISNNVSTGDSTATMLTKVASAITTLNGLGYTYGVNLFLTNIMNRNDVDVTAHNTALAGAYSDLIDLVTTFKDPADTGISPTRSDDGIHLLPEGQQDYAMLVATYLLDKGLISVAELPKPYFRIPYYQGRNIKLGNYATTAPVNPVEISSSGDESQLHINHGGIYGGYIGSIGNNSLDLFGGLARKAGGYVSRQSSGSGIWMSSGGINFVARSGMTVDAAVNITTSATTWKGGLDSTGKWTFSSQGSGVVIYDAGTGTTRGLDIHQSSNNTTGGQLLLSKNRSGTLTGVATVVNGDTIGTIAFAPSDGTSYLQAVKLLAVSNGTVATGSVPTDFVIQTGSSSSPTERMRITSAGVVSLNSITSATTANVLYYDTTSKVVTYGAVGATTLADDDYGDITVSGTGTIMTIDNLAVTNAKINDVAWSKITSIDAQVSDLAGLSYAGNALKVIRVNAGETSWELVTPSAGGGYTVTTVTAATHNETATSGEVILICDTTSNNITVNLPTAVGNTAKITVKRKIGGSNTLTVDGATTETIDGGLTASLVTQYEAITLISDNTNWYII